ncbi:unnamed protein product [Mortierella alpina]
MSKTRYSKGLRPSSTPTHTSASRRISHLVLFLCGVVNFLSITYWALHNTGDLQSAINTAALADSRIDVMSLGNSRDFVYKFIIERSDLAFYKTQKIWDDLILIAENPERAKDMSVVTL